MNKVLERVQGPARTRIEAARAAAAVKRAAASAAWKKARYEQLQRAEHLVLYPPRPLPNAAKIVADVKLVSLSSDPFRSGELFASGKPAPKEIQGKLLVKPVKKRPVPAASGAAPARPAPAAESDPFGSGPAPKTPPKKTAPPTKEEDDPFGS